MPVNRQPTIELYATPRSTSTCRGCNQPIVWRLTVLGRRIPFDRDPDVIDTREEKGQVIETVDPKATHFRTCPKAKDFQRRRRQEPRDDGKPGQLYISRQLPL